MKDWNIIIKPQKFFPTVTDNRVYVDIPIRNTTKYYRIYQNEFDTRVYLSDKESQFDDFDIDKKINASLMYWDSNGTSVGRVESVINYLKKVF
jgi:hypothetical protein